jgi:DNA-directed RNA polymerase specialized sigma24 family protein
MGGDYASIRQLIASTVRSFRLQDADAYDADAHAAVQTTWLRLAEHAHQIREPERLGSWLITTARRPCLQILRQTKPAFDNFDVVAETVAGSSEGPEQRVVDADTARIL